MRIGSSVLVAMLVCCVATKGYGSPPATPPRTAPVASHPFNGHVVDVRQLAHGAGASPEAFLGAMYRDPFIAALGPKMKLDDWLGTVKAGRPFDAAAFRNAAHRAIREYMASADGANAMKHLEARTPSHASRLLHEKMEVLEMALSQPHAVAPPPAAERTVGKEHPFLEMYVHRMTPGSSERHGRAEVVSLEPVPGARVAAVSRHEPIGAKDDLASRMTDAESAYARQLVPQGRKPQGITVEAIASKDVGRAVVGRVRARADGVQTEDVLKGGGPTRFADNPHSSLKTGTFSVQEAADDWRNTEMLKRAGVPVYEPIAIVKLPYMEWHETKGYKPLGTYVRRPLENLRMSDVLAPGYDAFTLGDHGGTIGGRATPFVVERLRQKIQQYIDSSGEHRAVTADDVVPFVVERLGRTVGLLEGGGFPGKVYFHGMLHEQNVSLLGEIVDVGKNVGLLETPADARKAFDASLYPEAHAKYPIRKPNSAAVETDGLTEGHFLRYMAERLNARLGSHMSRADVVKLFDTAVAEGKRGVKANDPSVALRRVGP